MTLIQVKVDDSELQSAFAQLAQRMDDLQPVMASIGEYMVRATDDRFRNQQDPEGNPWASLQPDKGYTKFPSWYSKKAGRQSYWSGLP